MLPRAREYGIVLEKDFNEALPETWFDPDGIHRCLLNLLTNALDACIDIDCRNKNSRVVFRLLLIEGWAVEYQVEDNGCGMDEETSAKIFQSFFSTKGTRGTGLGLMITKKIIDEHGGCVSLESEMGKGSKFSIKIPKKSGPKDLKTD